MTRDESGSARPDDDPADASAAGKMGFSEDGSFFFGTSPTEKKSLRKTPDVKKIDPLKDLDLNAARRKAPSQVGENVRLIDLAMDDDKFREAEEPESKGLPTLPPFKKTDGDRRPRRFAGRKTGRRFVEGFGDETAAQAPKLAKEGPLPKRALPKTGRHQALRRPTGGPAAAGTPSPPSTPRPTPNPEAERRVKMPRVSGPRSQPPTPQPRPHPGAPTPGRPPQRPGPPPGPAGGRPHTPRPSGLPPKPPGPPGPPGGPPAGGPPAGGPPGSGPRTRRAAITPPPKPSSQRRPGDRPPGRPGPQGG